MLLQEFVRQILLTGEISVPNIRSTGWPMEGLSGSTGALRGSLFAENPLR